MLPMEGLANMDVEIRRAEPSDARGVKDIYDCRSAYETTLQLPHPSIALWEKRLASTPDNVYMYVALLDGEIVGTLGLEVCQNPRRRHVGSLGMGVKDKAQGSGVGTALLSTAIDLADNWLALRRLELTVYVDNKRAIDLYKRFGFDIEGEAKDFAFRGGEYVGAFYMARLGDEQHRATEQ